MKPITTAILVRCGADPDKVGLYVDLLNELLPYYRIISHLRLSHFIAQILHESDRMRAVREYDTGEAYEGRLNLGNIHPGDGVKFKGRGLIQLTGRSNYEWFAIKFKIDCVNHPEILEMPRYALAAALFYWDTRKLNGKADQDNALAVSQIINMGSVPKPMAKRQIPNGWADRQKLTTRCKAVLAELF